MRRCRGLFRPSDAFFRLQFSADYTITMFGFDFRQGQGPEPRKQPGSTMHNRFREKRVSGE